MKDLTDAIPLAHLTDALAEVNRELAMRRAVYPHLVANKKITAAAAARNSAALRQAAGILQLLRDQYPPPANIMDTAMHTATPSIILFSGRANSGKSRAAYYLQKHYGFDTEQIARPLKRMACALFGISLADMEDGATKRARIDDGPAIGLTPRLLLQGMGDIVRQSYGDDILIRSLITRIRRAGRLCPRLAIPDLRRNEESYWLRDAFPARTIVTVLIIRPDAAPAGGDPEHWTEHATITPDHTILNNGTLADYNAKLNQLMTTLNLSPMRSQEDHLEHVKEVITGMHNQQTPTESDPAQ